MGDLPRIICRYISLEIGAVISPVVVALARDAKEMPHSALPSFQLSPLPLLLLLLLLNLSLLLLNLSLLLLLLNLSLLLLNLSLLLLLLLKLISLTTEIQLFTAVGEVGSSGLKKKSDKSQHLYACAGLVGGKVLSAREFECINMSLI